MNFHSSTMLFLAVVTGRTPVENHVIMTLIFKLRTFVIHQYNHNNCKEIS